MQFNHSYSVWEFSLYASKNAFKKMHLPKLNKSIIKK